MPVAELLPPDTDLGLHADQLGPVRAADFETWPQDQDNPMELIAGWVVPMSPVDFPTGVTSADLTALLQGLAKDRGWTLAHDARHRLPFPRETTCYPALALHCTHQVEMLGRSRTASRVPDLVIEILGEETAERDRAPKGAKFVAYEKSGVREYYYCWPDGREASGFHLAGGVFVPQAQDGKGYFASPLLGCRLRLVPAGVK